ncbi:bactofilin family protein [Crocinitomix catalasitica]|uniref:bactofilin family protein n=1 Tax=Crocinitomix catalasitica TaxID=184607 RepID=UPI00068403D8|nr:polymer-forming cytoskeletal protein [Crocinitomix catalasitica]
MFKGGNGKEGQTNSPDKLNRIVEGTVIVGEIKADSNFRIEGTLEGSLDTLGKLVVGPTGKIDGQIKCANADIEGEIKGDLVVDGLLSIKSTAKIVGNITTNKIEIEVGAVFQGVCNYANQKDAPLLAKKSKMDKAEDAKVVY